MPHGLERHPRIAARRQPPDNPLAELPISTDARFLANQVVRVGWGRVGKHIAGALEAKGVPFVVAESNREFVETLRAMRTPAVWGDATRPEVLIQAHVTHARALVIAMPETIHVRRMVEVARTLNPGIEVVVRSHNTAEAELLERAGAGTVFFGESELVKAMTRFVLERVERVTA